MKKLFFIFLASMLLFTFVGCDTSAKEDEQSTFEPVVAKVSNGEFEVRLISEKPIYYIKDMKTATNFEIRVEITYIGALDEIVIVPQTGELLATINLNIDGLPPHVSPSLRKEYTFKNNETKVVKRLNYDFEKLHYKIEKGGIFNVISGFWYKLASDDSQNYTHLTVSIPIIIK